MNPIYEIQIHGTQEYGGTVNEMTGDGIMALFGAPIRVKGAPQRALHSAFAIRREMVRFSEKMKQDRPDLPTLRVRIGIHRLFSKNGIKCGFLKQHLVLCTQVLNDGADLLARRQVFQPECP